MKFKARQDWIGGLLIFGRPDRINTISFTARNSLIVRTFRKLGLNAGEALVGEFISMFQEGLM